MFPQPGLRSVLARSLEARLKDGKIDLSVVEDEDEEDTLLDEKEEEVEVEVRGVWVVVVVVVAVVAVVEDGDSPSW